MHLNPKNLALGCFPFLIPRYWQSTHMHGLHTGFPDAHGCTPSLNSWYSLQLTVLYLM